MKFIVTCPGCSNRTTIENQSAMGRRATCKKCGAAFLIDGTVAREVGDASRELIRQAEESHTNEPQKNVVPISVTSRQSPRMYDRLAKIVFSDATNNALLLYSLAACAVVILSLYCWVSIVWPNRSPGENKVGPISFEINHPLEKLGVDEDQWVAVCTGTGTPLRKGEDGNNFRLYSCGEHVAAMVYGDARNLNKIVVAAFAKDLLRSKVSCEQFVKLANTSAFYVKPGFATHFDKFLGENLLKAVVDSEHASQIHQLATIGAMWCTKSEEDHIIYIAIVSSISDTDTFEGKR